MANDPKKHVVRITQPGAGRMRAQSPESVGRKAALLSRDLETTKADISNPVIQLDNSVNPYDVQSSDQFLVCYTGTGSGAFTVRLPEASANGGRRIVILKRNADVTAVTLSALGTDLIVSYVSGATQSKSFSGADRPMLELICDNTNGGWFAIAENGTIT